MEALKEIIEIFKEFDGNNVWIVIGISAVLLFIAAGYIQLLNASKIEAILMDQKEESKRFGFIYLILFAVFGIINYIFIIDIELVLANVVLWFLTLVSPVILKKLKNKWSIDEKYLLCGNKRKINDSTKTRLFSIDYIVEQNLCFEKVNTSAE